MFQAKPLTIELIEIINGKNARIKPQIVNLLIDLASKNKVLLDLLRILDIHSSLRDIQEEALKKEVEATRTISEVLRRLDFAFFKLLKPVAYIPSDIDVLIKLEDASKAIKRMKRVGYKAIVKEPYCIEFNDGSLGIDLYTYPTLGSVAYIDGQALLEFTATAEFGGMKIRTLESCAEAVITAAHAVYKEGIYTLNDFFVIKKWVSKRSFKLAEELNCEPALRLATNLNRMIEKGSLEVPYRLPPPMLFTLMLRKLYNDDLARATLSNILRALRDPRLGKLVLWRLTRPTY